MNYRLRYRPLYLGLALGITILVWWIGAYLFPRTRIVVLSVIVFLSVAAWLIDAITQSVRRRMSAGKKIG
jgi:hypothetical protein